MWTYIRTLEISGGYQRFEIHRGYPLVQTLSTFYQNQHLLFHNTLKKVFFYNSVNLIGFLKILPDHRKLRSPPPDSTYFSLFIQRDLNNCDSRRLKQLAYNISYSGIIEAGVFDVFGVIKPPTEIIENKIDANRICDCFRCPRRVSGARKGLF